jgi:GxxExxY protein
VTDQRRDDRKGHEADHHDGLRGHDRHYDNRDHDGLRGHDGHDDGVNHDGSRRHDVHDDGKHDGLGRHNGHGGKEHHDGLRGHDGHDGGGRDGSRLHDGHDDVNHDGLRSHDGHDDDQVSDELSDISGMVRRDRFLAAGRDPSNQVTVPDLTLDRGHAGWRPRTLSPLSPREEHVITRVIDCAMVVHRELGPGFLESIYQKAMVIELEEQGIAWEAERSIRVRYRAVDIPGQRVDLIVEGLIVIELKTVVRFDSIHVAQVLSYLKTLHLRGGLLINFRSRLLKDGLKRVVL